jgi:hypothetical protein
MKKHYLFVILPVLSLLLVQVLSAKPANDITKYFPDIEGFEKAGRTQMWYPENLKDAIDGAADIYLDYGFVEMASLKYDKADGQSITIEIFQHENPDYGFGIYSQERNGTLIQNFIDVGAQGYYVTGLLNFFKGCYYVKISGKGLKDEEVLLTDVARLIAGMLPGKNSLPSIYDDFPVVYRRAYSERLVARNFLGYPFFEMAFTANYNVPGVTYFPYFIIRCSSQEECRETLQAYMNFIEKDQDIKQGRITVDDPYYGIVDLMWTGNLIKGTYAIDDSSIRTEVLTFDRKKFKVEKIKNEVACNKTATSSSVEDLTLTPQNVIDGDLSTRWSTEFTDPQWICIDLGKDYIINRIKLTWESAYGHTYNIEVSADSTDWIQVFATQDGDGGEDEIDFDPVKARYVRLNGLERGTPWGYSIYEFQVFKGKR